MSNETETPEELAEDPRTVVTISASALNTLQNCPREYQYSSIERWTKAIPDSRPEQGSYLHKLLETYYAPDLLSRDIEKIIYEQHIELFKGDSFLTQEEASAIEQLFREYCEHYAGEDWVPLFVEKPFTKVLFEDEDYIFAFQGKVDLGARTRFMELLVVDHKLKGAFRTVPYRDNQAMGYAWAFDTPNVMMNLIGDQSSYEASKRFKRVLLSYPRALIEEWAVQTSGWIKMLIMFYKNDHWPMSNTSCDKYRGCTFKDVCTMPANSRLWKLENKYKKKDHVLFATEESDE